MTKRGGPETGRMFSERTVGGELPTRQVLRFGARVSLGDVRTLPGRSRSGAGGPSGVLAEARLRARAGEFGAGCGRRARSRVVCAPWH